MTVHLLIKGKVQGVYYRAAAADVAEQLFVTGWIRNTPEGDVEAMVTGDADRVKEFIAWCNRGPSRAKVQKVMTREMEHQAFEKFEIRR